MALTEGVFCVALIRCFFVETGVEFGEGRFLVCFLFVATCVRGVVAIRDCGVLRGTSTESSLSHSDTSNSELQSLSSSSKSELSSATSAVGWYESFFFLWLLFDLGLRTIVLLFFAGVREGCGLRKIFASFLKSSLLETSPNTQTSSSSLGRDTVCVVC